MQKGAIWPFVDTFSLVQYLPGVTVGPSAPESAVCLLSNCPPPHSSLGEKRVDGVGSSPLNQGTLWSQGE